MNNAALRSIAQHDTRKDYRKFVEQLAEAPAIQTPTRRDLFRIDRNRSGKGSNGEWKHWNDPNAPIKDMKDGCRDFPNKGYDVLDINTGAVLGARL